MTHADPDYDKPRHPAVIATAIALPVALIVGVIVAAVITARSAGNEPVAVSGTVPAPEAESAACAALLDALPDALGDYERAELAEPAPAGAAAWSLDGSEPLVLRCGVERPLDFDAASVLQHINKVDWFEVSGQSVGIEASTWFAVDRGVYIAFTLPYGSGPTPIQDISNAIAETLEQQPIDPAPIN